MKTLLENALLRRLITVPAFILLSLFLIATSPVWIPIAWLFGLLYPPAKATLRCICFITVYVSTSMCGLMWSNVYWVWHWLTRADAETRIAAQIRVQHWWANLLRASAEHLFRLKFTVEGEDALLGPGALMLPRHTSIGDTVLPFSQYAIPHDKRLRYVMKRELLLDPALDIVGNRFPNYFVDRVADNIEQELSRMQTLTRDMRVDDGLVIYIEGTRFTEPKRERVLKLFAEQGRQSALDRARQLDRVLPPRPTGTIALMQAAPERDIIFMAHTGFEGSASFGSLISGGWLDTEVKIRFWRVPAAEIPRDNEGAKNWLNEQWLTMNRVVTELATGKRHHDDGQ